jgi:hypothetical protein
MFRVWRFKKFWRYRVPELLLPEEPGLFKKTQWHFLCSNWFHPASSSEKLFTRSNILLAILWISEKDYTWGKIYCCFYYGCGRPSNCRN